MASKFWNEIYGGWTEIAAAPLAWSSAKYLIQFQESLNDIRERSYPFWGLEIYPYTTKATTITKNREVEWSMHLIIVEHAEHISKLCDKYSIEYILKLMRNRDTVKSDLVRTVDALWHNRSAVFAVLIDSN